jgi:DNA-binding transcriptional MocR family regulator
MNAGQTAGRVYDGLRRLILDHGVRPGDRLEPAQLADMLAASITPVRDALNRLLGEGLVVTRPNDGFQMPALDEPLLRDRYRWNREVLILALANAPTLPDAPQVADAMAEPRLADRTGRLFALLAAGSGNGEHGMAVEGLNARLHAVRTVEPELLDPSGHDLAGLADAASAGDRARLRKNLAAYHRARERLASAIVRAAYRN